MSDPDGPAEVRPESPRSSGAAFVGDLDLSLRAMGRAPLLVVLSLALSALMSLHGPAGLLTLPVAVVYAGFVGTQRVWFARLFDGDKLAVGELWPVTRRYIGRFIALGLAVGAALLPILLIAVTLHRGVANASALLVVLGVCVGVVMDFALTFVVPALAFTTDSVRTAWDLGIGMLREHWPASLWYALTPGLTIVAIGRLLQHGSPSVVEVALTTAIAGFVSLWFKGAIVAFYLRHQPAASPND
jgi:hypothetical protein